MCFCDAWGGTQSLTHAGKFPVTTLHPIPLQVIADWDVCLCWTMGSWWFSTACPVSTHLSCDFPGETWTSIYSTQLGTDDSLQLSLAYDSIVVVYRGVVGSRAQEMWYSQHGLQLTKAASLELPAWLACSRQLGCLGGGSMLTAIVTVHITSEKGFAKLKGFPETCELLLSWSL